MTKPDIIEFVTDPQLLGLTISVAQDVLLRATYGLPLPTSEHHEIWQLCSGGRSYRDGHRFSEITALCGAGSGKDSRIAVPVALYEALFGGHETRLAKGERGIIPFVAQDLKATAIAYTFAKEYIEGSALLASRIADVKAREIIFDNGLLIFCFPCTQKALRGWAIPAAVLDELAYFRVASDQADSDVEIQASIRRGTVRFPQTILVKISTPYLKLGVLHDDYKKSFGTDDPDLLVFKAPSVLMNPTLEGRLDRERRLDPARFAREYEAEFADDLSAFLPAAWIDVAVQVGRHELSPRSGVTYLAATDPSGGGPDAFTFTICHREGDRFVQDVIKGYHRQGTQSPDLSAAVKEICQTLQRYGLREITGDKYAGAWVRQEFQRAGVTYRESDYDRSRAYAECEPLFAQGRVELLDHPQQTREFRLLEKTLRPGGGARIDHPRGQHDDFANVAALAIAKLASHIFQCSAKHHHVLVFSRARKSIKCCQHPRYAIHLTCAT